MRLVSNKECKQYEGQFQCIDPAVRACGSSAGQWCVVSELEARPRAAYLMELETHAAISMQVATAV